MNKFQLLLQNPQKFFRLARERFNPKGRVSPIKRAEYKARYNMTLADWTIRHHTKIQTKHVTWMGIPVWKNVLDLHIYQEIIFEQRPEVIVEIGSAHGGSTLYFAHLCDILGKGAVVSVDVDHTQFQVKHDRITCITGASHAREVLRKVHDHARGRHTLVIQDADHSKEAVLMDLNNYADLVPPGGYFIVEDGIIDVFHSGNGVGRSFDGPLCAVEEFLKQNSAFELDETRERYLITQNPTGYLRRLK